MKPINIYGLENWLISENGIVKHRYADVWKKQSINNCGYHQYYFTNIITGKKGFLKVHRLVAFTYIGLPPTPKHEINHIDADKSNNHYTNLEWVTHSENVLKSYREQGRVNHSKGKSRPSPGLETRILMANAKFKKVNVYISGEYYKTFDSIADLCKEFNWYRKKFNRVMNNNGEYKKMYLKFV